MANESPGCSLNAGYTGSGMLPTETTDRDAALMPQFNYILPSDSPHPLVELNRFRGERRKRIS